MSRGLLLWAMTGISGATLWGLIVVAQISIKGQGFLPFMIELAFVLFCTLLIGYFSVGTVFWFWMARMLLSKNVPANISIIAVAFILSLLTAFFSWEFHCSLVGNYWSDFIYKSSEARMVIGIFSTTGLYWTYYVHREFLDIKIA